MRQAAIGLAFLATALCEAEVAVADNAVCEAHPGEWTVTGEIMAADRVPGSFFMMLTANERAEPLGGDVPAAAKAGECLVGSAGGAQGVELPENCAPGGKVTMTGDLYFDSPNYAGIRASKVTCE